MRCAAMLKMATDDMNRRDYRTVSSLAQQSAVSCYGKGMSIRHFLNMHFLLLPYELLQIDV